jgi:hypothetical protein
LLENGKFKKVRVVVEEDNVFYEVKNASLNLTKLKQLIIVVSKFSSFFINLWFGNEKIPCLIYTGADVPIISDTVALEGKFKKTNTRLIYACGNTLNVIGTFVQVIQTD